MPLDMDNGCQSNGHQRHGGSANGAGNGHWMGTLEEAKETILHLRETMVHQKEMILDQRETMRELTAKLSRCETHSRRHSEHHGNHQEENHNHKHSHHEGGHWGHHDNAQRGHHEDVHQSHHEDGHRGHRDAGHQDLHEGHHAQENEHHQTAQPGNHEPQVGHNTHDSSHKAPTSAQTNAMEDPPNEASAAIHQMERMLKSLKERLEHLQVLAFNFSMHLIYFLKPTYSLITHLFIIHQSSYSSSHLQPLSFHFLICPKC